LDLVGIVAFTREAEVVLRSAKVVPDEEERRWRARVPHARLSGDRLKVGAQTDVIEGDVFVGRVEVVRVDGESLVCKIISTGWVADAEFEPGQLAVIEEP
jgi:hypothetical protein